VGAAGLVVGQAEELEAVAVAEELEGAQAAEALAAVGRADDHLALRR